MEERQGSSKSSSHVPVAEAAPPSKGTPLKKPVPVADPSSSSSKKGRPKRNMVADCNNVASEFAEVESESPAFFGTGSRAQLQWLNRLRDSIMDRTADDEPEVSQEELLRSKKNWMLSSLSAKLPKNTAPTHSDLDQTVLEEMHFLSMEPQVQDPLLTLEGLSAQALNP